MAKIYYKRIIAEEIKLEDVPARWRSQVEKMLESEGA